MADIFHEVEAQLRSDRYRTFALKALPWVAGLVILALVTALGVWLYNSHRQGIDGKASEAYAAGLEALQAGDAAKAEKQFAASAEAGSKGYRTLSLMQQAGLKLNEDKVADAVALLDQAAEAGPTPLLADAARLQAAYALMDSAKPADVEARLQPLLAEGRPFRVEAREALAFSKLAAGQVKAARGDFVVLNQSLETPQNVRTRAQAAVAVIDSGVAASIPEVLKAAKSLSLQDLAPPTSSPTPQAGTAQ